MNTLETIDLTTLDMVAGNTFLAERLTISEIVIGLLNGTLDLNLGNIFSWLMQSIFWETSQLIYLFRYLIILAILSAIFKAVSSSFKTDSVHKLGFYASYILVISVLFASLTLAVGIMSDMLHNIALLLQTATPVIITLLASGGYVASASAFAPIIIFISTFIATFIDRLLAPTITFVAIIHLLGYLFDKEKFETFSESAIKGIKFCIKSVTVIFIGIISIQRLATPVMNNVGIRGARFAVSAVPVVGSALSNAMDTAIFYARGLRSAVSAALSIGAVLITVVPIIQILAFIVMYKVTAILVAPIADERISKALMAMSDYASLMLSICVIIGFLFVFIVLATLTI